MMKGVSHHRGQTDAMNHSSMETHEDKLTPRANIWQYEVRRNWELQLKLETDVIETKTSMISLDLKCPLTTPIFLHTDEM
ncbi:hypothetical protein MKX01_011545 [Papaver californicum]|nr:hypothetical protein MKX01_011545 [Papaver californicum]